MSLDSCMLWLSYNTVTAHLKPTYFVITQFTLQTIHILPYLGGLRLTLGL
jgi:hypothetical protein